MSRDRPWLGRVSLGGWLFAGSLAVAAATAILTGNNLVFLIAAALVATLMMSNLVSRLSLAGLELDFRLPEHVSARRAFAARVLARNAKRWMPSFSIRLVGAGGSVFQTALYFPVLPGGRTVEEVVEVGFRKRGVHQEDNFEFRTSFPFGFLERRANVSLRRKILVYPCLDPQPGFEELLGSVSGEVSAHYRGRGHDFYRIRAYEAFESARHVDWKATARTGALQVREFAREEEPLVEILFDAGVPPQFHAWFEKAVECCAFLSWRLVEREARVRFLSQDVAITVPATGEIHDILKYLALVEPRKTGALPSPMEESAFHLIFTASPERFTHPGWSQARFVTPESLPAGDGL